MHVCNLIIVDFAIMENRYMAPPPPAPYDPYGGYSVQQLPLPSPPVAAPGSYTPSQVNVKKYFVLFYHINNVLLTMSMSYLKVYHLVSFSRQLVLSKGQSCPSPAVFSRT